MTADCQEDTLARLVAPVVSVGAGVAFAFYVHALGCVEWNDAGLVLFQLQLALNFANTPTFGGPHGRRGSLAIACALLVLVAGCAVVFVGRSALAGGLLAPYVVWLGAHVARTARSKDTDPKRVVV